MGDDVTQIDGTECMGCILYAVTCPTEAFGLREIRGEDFVPENKAV
jgi:Fe-S-cluster-containing hydrogenase component 2